MWFRELLGWLVVAIVLVVLLVLFKQAVDGF